MQHDTATFLTTDGLTLFTRQWTPTDPPRATVLLVHGIHEHSGRYAYAASVLMTHGIEVRAFDLRGHGQSEGDRGTVESFDDYVDDLAGVHAAVQADAAGRPLFLMGHSMGGLIVARHTVLYGDAGMAGLVLSSPALQVDAPAPLRTLAPVLSRWLPNLPASRVDLDALSRDPRVGRAYKEDPHCIVAGVKARIGAEILAAVEAVRAHPEAFTVPLYLFHGTDDRLTNPDGTRWLADHPASDDITLTLYPGLLHETMNEPERDTVLEDLAAWIETHL